MIVQRSLLVVLFNLFAATSVDSFSISTPSFRASTCLRAEEESAGEAEAAPAGGSAAGDDILSSPAFLKKKLDVLKNDIAQIDTEIEEGKKVVEAAKAEWGPQLDGLQSEVSSFY